MGYRNVWLGDREIVFLFPFLFGLSQKSGALQVPEK